MIHQNRVRGKEMRGLLIALTVPVWLSSAPVALAREMPPTETKGVSVDSQVMLNLATQLPELRGYALRIRKITFEPGAVLAHHSLAERPTAAYVISGEFTDVRDGGQAVVRGPGDHWVEGADYKHWGANRGQVPTVVIAVDIVPKK